ncbi:UNVERIFIED_CONTAM: hypothetical protein Slati_0904000 [Sesamum latifolium]|uniref:Uncharacterized protein n=1 Tax=Sesamum latifolium TaxID=2727402 RepID=A0AAW2XPX2_9LAMI
MDMVGPIQGNDLEFCTMGIELGGFDLKAKGKDVGRWMRKNDEAELADASALSAPVVSAAEGKENRKMVRQSKVAYDICMNYQRALEGECRELLSSQVLQLL